MLIPSIGLLCLQLRKMQLRFLIFLFFVVTIFVLLLFDLKLLLKDAIFCMSLFIILVATFALYKRSIFFFTIAIIRFVVVVSKVVGF